MTVGLPARIAWVGPLGLWGLPALLLALSTAPAGAQKGMPMTPERLTSITHGRTLSLRCRAMPLSQVLPNVTQQMMYRTRLAPETADLPLSVFCSGARLYEFEQAMTALFGYRLVGRSQGEGMGLYFVPDLQAMAAAGRQRLQGRTAAEAGIARALAWIREPAGLDQVVRTSCPAAGTLRDPNVKRAFTLYSTLTKRQRETVLSGHPVTVPVGALSPAGRAALTGIRPAAKGVTVYLHDDPWSESSHPRLAARVEPSGPTWFSCPPLALAPAHGPLPAEVAATFRMKVKGVPDLEDLEPGEEAPAMMEWLADQTGIWILAEVCRPFVGKPEALKKLGAELSGLTLEETLDRIASHFDATWRYDDGWVLFQRRSTETLTRGPAPAAVQIGRGP